MLLSLAACVVPSPDAGHGGVFVANLSAAGQGFDELRAAFVAANPGYDIEWRPACERLTWSPSARIAFVQGPVGGPATSTIGDALLLRAGETLVLADGPVDLLVYTLPEDLPAALPPTIRPDWDPRITDTPGGCADDQAAYRRILLTWLPEIGPYVLHTLNAHRVRITDSFSHYHPRDSGFDEFYLVQQAPDDARLLTSDQVPAIEAHTVTHDSARTLIRWRPLHVGDLVYLPRGTMHRGLGGAVVQVLSVPGFVPGTEVGVDHHLWAINRQLGLTGSDALPFHVVAARTAVVK